MDRFDSAILSGSNACRDVGCAEFIVVAAGSAMTFSFRKPPRALVPIITAVAMASFTRLIINIGHYKEWEFVAEMEQKIYNYLDINPLILLIAILFAAFVAKYAPVTCTLFACGASVVCTINYGRMAMIPKGDGPDSLLLDVLKRYFGPR